MPGREGSCSRAPSVCRPVFARSSCRRASPPVELIIKCSALAGGLARSPTGVWARAAAGNSARKIGRKEQELRSAVMGGIQKKLQSGKPGSRQGKPIKSEELRKHKGESQRR